MEFRKLAKRKGTILRKTDSPKHKPKDKIIKQILNTLKETTSEDLLRIKQLKPVGIHIKEVVQSSFAFISSSTADSFEMIAKRQQEKVKY